MPAKLIFFVPRGNKVMIAKLGTLRDSEIYFTLWQTSETRNKYARIRKLSFVRKSISIVPYTLWNIETFGRYTPTILLYISSHTNVSNTKFYYEHKIPLFQYLRKYNIIISARIFTRIKFEYWIWVGISKKL